jgi:hypothetical protein
MSKLNLIGLICCLSLLLACSDDDLKTAPVISSKKITLNKDRTINANVIYSDSAYVKARGSAPIFDKVTPSSGGGNYNEMPEGVKIEFFDKDLVVTGTITSKYAINKEAEKITIFRKNVVVVNDNFTFTTEELTWDENQKMYFSPAGTVIKKADGSIMSGTEFRSPQDFSTFFIKQGAGSTYVKGDLTQ